MTAPATDQHALPNGPAGSARRALDDEWQVLDRTGQAVGIIWRSPDGWRCAANATPRAAPGILDRDFDTVLRHALTNFA